jgi:hypothetical protein
MKRLTSVGSDRVPWRKHARRLEDLVGLAQFAVLTLQRLQPLALIRRQAIAARALVGLGLAHPLPQRLTVDAEVLGDMRDRPTAFKDKPHRAFAQLIGVFLRGRHTAETVPLPRMKILA